MPPENVEDEMAKWFGNSRDHSRGGRRLKMVDLVNEQQPDNNENQQPVEKCHD